LTVDGFDVIWRARRAVLPGGESAADLGVRAGRIASVAAYGGLDGGPVHAYGPELALLPGLVDTHVHVNEPGRTEWEGFATATRAAAAGGVTTIVDMPLNSIPPTIGVAELAVKRAAAAGQVYADVAFWGGAVPGNLGSLRPLHDAGVLGFKCFLLPSGVEEFPPLDPADLLPVLTELATFDGLLVVHAEDAATIATAGPARGRRYADFLRSRPDEAERVAVAAVVAAARRTGARVHLLHLSSATVLDRVAAARADGVRVTVETCPHYLFFAAEEVPDGATAFKCCPPIRDAANRDRLWAALADGVIDIVVSDHSPCTPELKALDTGDFGTAWGGVASLQLAASAVWTGARRRGHRLADLVRWLSTGPAALVGLDRKGTLAVGADADACVFAPDEAFTVEPARLHHRSPVTPYAGASLAGVVRETWLRGARIGGDGPPRGRLIDRDAP